MNKFSPLSQAREELVCARSDQISKWSEKCFETATVRSFQPGPKRDLIKFNRMPCFSSYKREYFNTLPDHVHSGESRGPVIAVSRSLHNLRYGKRRKTQQDVLSEEVNCFSWKSLTYGLDFSGVWHKVRFFFWTLFSLVVTMLSS